MDDEGRITDMEELKGKIFRGGVNPAIRAEWCAPCKMIAPLLTEIAEEYDGRLKIAKLNIDENPQTPPKFGIRGIPTLILFKNGTVEGQKVGALSKSQLTAFLDTNL